MFGSLLCFGEPAGKRAQDVASEFRNRLPYAARQPLSQRSSHVTNIAFAM